MLLKRIRNRYLRAFMLGLLALVLLLGSWFLLGRLTSPGRRVQVRIQDAAGEMPPTVPGPLRIGTFNIAHGRGLNHSNWGVDRRDEHLQQIALLLRAANLDVVVLNEVDFDATWSGNINQAALLAEAAGYRHWAEQRNIDVSLPFLRFGHGNAVLSRLPIVEARAIDYPGYSMLETALAGKKRGLLCTLDTGDGAQLNILAVHLEHRDEEVRLRSAGVIAQLQAKSPQPLILAGDFNSTLPTWPVTKRVASGKTAVDELLDSEVWTTHRPPAPGRKDLTFPANAPTRVIDWILVPQDWVIHRYDVIDVQLSDHRPVFAEVAVPAPDK